MEQSIYFQYVQKYFPALVLRIQERLNDQKDTELSYLFKELLTPSYSVDGRWATILGKYRRVAADVVAMDSEIPLKKRAAYEKATGEIPKLAIMLWLTEKNMSDIDAMIALGLPEDEIVSKILEDTKAVIEGMYERLELMFLQGLSTGIALADDSDNIGTGVRVNYQYLDENKFGVSALWDNPAAKPLDDITKVYVKARNDANRLIYAYTDRATIDKLLASTQMRELFAFSQSFVGTQIPVPFLDKANPVLRSKYGFEIREIDRQIKTERDGKDTMHTPWKEGTIIFTEEKVVGSLVWTNLAEASRPAKQATYAKVDGHILVSKFSTVQPTFAEFTSAQSRVVPIISNVDKIYLLDTKTIEA